MHASSTPYQRYKQQEVLTASPIELIIMLYDGCIKQLKLARIAIQESEIENANKSLQKASRIIVELVNSLDFHYPMAKDLLNLYEFMLGEIRSCNATKDVGPIEGVLELLGTLRESWVQIARSGIGSLAVMEE